jgi:1-deoxy-D-xylulose-5-phosphate reductoisomerase
MVADDAMMRLVVLGSTGSIGLSTLDVAARHPDRYRVLGLAAQSNVERLREQCLRFAPPFAAMADEAAAAELRRQLAAEGCPTEVRAGADAARELAALDEADCVVAGIVGAAGLRPTLAAAEKGKRILLANKEVLVMAGAVFMDVVRRTGALLMPIDSEHNAIFQCLPPDFGGRGLAASGVRRILLTASGGPFRRAELERLADVTPEEACAHPNWSMGRKISVDSATMMNKGLELIEACLLFDAAPDKVEVVLHPQSIIHSMVEYVDGSVLAQLGNPDMRTPIAHALAWPERTTAGVGALDLVKIGRLDFEAPDLRRYPCLGLAYDALRAGGTACAVLNAANEVAVAEFLARRIRFTDIARVVGGVLERTPAQPVRGLEDVLAADAQARTDAQAVVQLLTAG